MKRYGYKIAQKAYPEFARFGFIFVLEKEPCLFLGFVFVLEKEPCLFLGFIFVLEWEEEKETCLFLFCFRFFFGFSS